MNSFSDHEFEFKQNHNQTNLKNSNRAIHRQPKHNFVNDNKMIICSNEKYGINIEQHLNKIQNFYEQKLLKQNIMKAVIGTFQKKKIISQGQFQTEKAFQDATNQSKAYVDKLQTWLGDSIACSPALQQFQRYKQKKLCERTAKINSIINLTQKIAMKLQEKKIQAIKKQFQASLQQKIVKIPQNKQYNKAAYKLKFIKERAIANARQLQNRQSNFH